MVYLPTFHLIIYGTSKCRYSKYSIHGASGIDTLRKFNTEPKIRDSFQKESPIQGCHFQVPCENLGGYQQWPYLQGDAVTGDTFSKAHHFGYPML